jgi:hypothetical protein
MSAAVLVGGLLIVALARWLSRRPVEAESGPRYLRLLAILFTLQLAAFAVQETAEAMVSGAPAASVDVLLLCGTLGQLPIAAVAALALRWLLVRVGPALASVFALLAPVKQPAPNFAAAIPVPAISFEVALASGIAGAAVRKRGPPSF